MSEIPEHSCHDSESSESEKDSVCEIFDTVINFLEYIYEDVSKDSSIFKDLVEKYKPVIDSLKQAKDAYDQSPEYLEIRYDFYEVSSRLKEEFNKEYKASLNAFISSLDKIFPAKIAEVNVPKYCNLEGHKIPKVKKFQRNNNLSPDAADSEYIQLTLETKETVIDSVHEKDDTSSFIEFEVSQPEYDPVRENTDRLVKLLADFSGIKYDEFNAMLESNVDVRMERVEAFFNYERDLEWAKTILDCADGMRDLDEELLAREYTEIVFEENCPNVRTLAKSVVEEKMESILEGELKVLSEKFRTYEVAGEIASGSLKKVAKRKRSNKSKPTIEEGSSQLVEIGLKAGDAVTLDSETFPWLKEDSIVDVLHVERGGDGTVVAVVDARTEEAKKVEHKMTGYENDEKKRDILPIIKDKLTMAAKCVATSEDKSVGLPIGLNNRLRELYPFIIYAWKEQTHNAKRVYVSKVSIEDMPDESETKKSLQEAGVTEVVLFLGACDKQNQESLVALFIDGNSRDAAKYGAGA
ncbi:hypothetical protein [Candidatus Minimicrobia sp. QA0096]|uniref:hypothetical protein n=1 Tax=Candidatus Minimicrobia sp. QA0096 TaxID=3118470 RepID=UPI0030D1E686